jgi:NAD(P)H-dependent FMN reductase
MIVIASTRPGRVGLPVSEWFVQQAEEQGAFEIEVVDLAALNLPFLDEPRHPRFQQYEHQHTKDWSRKVDAADAFVFVMPEYNYGFNAPLKNAIDCLHREWQYKPVGFVSYGGVSAGTRAVQMIKQVVTALKMNALTEAVSIPFVAQFLNEARQIEANETMTGAARTMLDELQRLEHALAPLREPELAAV